MDSEKLELRALVNGKVQGVFYRDFVKKKAYPLNITGFVENLESGSVKVVAQGYEADLERFVEHLHKGPFGARVLKVDMEWIEEPQEEYRDFKVKY